MSETLGTASGGNRLLANRYELGELIGHGGMADVYRGHDRVLDRAVAVKIFRLPDDAAARKRFGDEGYALARLSHPGLVSIFDVGDVEHRPFLVMEFVDGVSVRSRLAAGALALAQTARLGGMLADALAHAHHRGVVHRDVKPSNIMLDADDLPHLTDFGIALLTDASHHTGANQIIGTPAYLAPEQLAGHDVGPAADVYALGLVLLECLTGEPEYASGTNLETALARLHRPPRIPEDLPPELAALLTAMTSTDPANRPTAQNCALRLLAIPAQPVTKRAAPHRPRVRALAASMAGIAAILVTLVVLLHPQQPPAGQASNSTGHAQRASGTSTAANPAGPAGGAGNGKADTGSRPAVGTLVANEHPALIPAATTPNAVSSTPPRSPGTSPSATSGDTPTPPTPPTSTTSTDPPTTSGSPAPTSPGQG